MQLSPEPITEDVPSAALPAQPDVHIHFSRPASFLVHNLGQEICGWIAAPPHLEAEALEFVVDGEPVAAHRYRREDVERAYPGCHVIGWTLWLDPAKTFGQMRRTLEFEIRLGDHFTHKRHFFKSKSLMPEGSDSPLYFMHVPKTAGTALRQFIDCAFSEFPALLVYGDPPGVRPEHVSDAYRSFAKTRELFFGHFDFDLTRRLNDRHAKVVALFRPPAELVRSYLGFNPRPVAEFLDNPLVRHVCGLSYTPPYGLVTAEHLDTALRLIEQHFFIVQHDGLQKFANEVCADFGLPHFAVPRINVGINTTAPAHASMPFDIRFDTQLYAACLRRSQSFLEFLNA